VTVTGSTFSYNVESSSVTASYGGPVTVSASTFNDNDGPSIVLYGVGDATITESDFSNNSYYSIHARYSEATITESTFRQNSNFSILADNSVIDLSSSRFVENSALSVDVTGEDSELTIREVFLSKMIPRQFAR
jgi:hypothetical protein